MKFTVEIIEKKEYFIEGIEAATEEEAKVKATELFQKNKDEFYSDGNFVMNASIYE